MVQVTEDGLDEETGDYDQADDGMVHVQLFKLKDVSDLASYSVREYVGGK